MRIFFLRVSQQLDGNATMIRGHVRAVVRRQTHGACVRLRDGPDEVGRGNADARTKAGQAARGRGKVDEVVIEGKEAIGRHRRAWALNSTAASRQCILFVSSSSLRFERSMHAL
jgi:hypothetical protein